MISVEDCVLQEEACLSTYVRGSGESMLKVVADMAVVSETVTAQEYKYEAERTRKDALLGSHCTGGFFGRSVG